MLTYETCDHSTPWIVVLYRVTRKKTTWHKIHVLRLYHPMLSSLVLHVHSQLFLSPHFAHGCGTSGYIDDSVLIYDSTSLWLPTSCLQDGSISRVRPCRQDNKRVQRNKRWQQSNNASKSSAQEECDTYDSSFILSQYLAHGIGSCTSLLHQ